MAKRRLYGWTKIALERIARDVCPVCEKPRSEWPEKRLKYTICSRACGDRIREVYNHPGAFRQKILRRDRVCQKCRGYPVSTQDLRAIDSDGLGVTLEGALRSLDYRGPYHYRSARVVVRMPANYLESHGHVYAYGARISYVARSYSLRDIESGNHMGFGHFHVRDDFPMTKAVHDEKPMPFWKIEYDDPEKFQVDHILPIEMDGEEFDEENVWTLCDWCHAWKTSKDLGYIAQYRKIQNPTLKKEFIDKYLERWGRNFACPPRGMTLKDKAWLKQQQGRIMAFHKSQHELGDYE